MDLKMCCHILRDFILSENVIKPSLIHSSNYRLMEWSECERYFIVGYVPVGCVRFLPNNKKIVNNFNFRFLWSCSIKLKWSSYQIIITSQCLDSSQTSLCSSTHYCNCSLMKLIQRHCIATDSILSSYAYLICSDRFEISNDKISVAGIDDI